MNSPLDIISDSWLIYDYARGPIGVSQSIDSLKMLEAFRGIRNNYLEPLDILNTVGTDMFYKLAKHVKSLRKPDFPVPDDPYFEYIQRVKLGVQDDEFINRLMSDSNAIWEFSQTWYVNFMDGEFFEDKHKFGRREQQVLFKIQRHRGKPDDILSIISPEAFYYLANEVKKYNECSQKSWDIIDRDELTVYKRREDFIKPYEFLTKEERIKRLKSDKLCAKSRIQLSDIIYWIEKLEFEDVVDDADDSWEDLAEDE